MAEQKLNNLANRCEDTAAEWTSRYFVELDGGKRADPDLLEGADIMLRLSTGFRDMDRRRTGSDQG